MSGKMAMIWLLVLILVFVAMAMVLIGKEPKKTRSQRGCRTK